MTYIIIRTPKKNQYIKYIKYKKPPLDFFVVSAKVGLHNL